MISSHNTNTLFYTIQGENADMKIQVMMGVVEYGNYDTEKI